MQEQPVTPSTCPKCGSKFDALTRVLGALNAPRPTDLTLCIDCGCLLQFDAELALRVLDEPPPDIDPSTRMALLCAQAFIHGRLDAQPQPDEHERERSAAAIRYLRGIHFTTLVVRSYLNSFPTEPPQFTLGPDEVGIVAPVSVLARRLCKNRGAWFIVTALLRLSKEYADDIDEPTYMMLETALKGAGIPFERVSLADLGLIEHDRRPS